jgi:hypothetical protein
LYSFILSAIRALYLFVLTECHGWYFRVRARVLSQATPYRGFEMDETTLEQGFCLF